MPKINDPVLYFKIIISEITSNVTTAGALMDSEVTNLAFVKSLTGGIAEGNVAQFTAAVADNDFLRIDGTEVEGLSATEVRTALIEITEDFNFKSSKLSYLFIPNTFSYPLSI